MSVDQVTLDHADVVLEWRLRGGHECVDVALGERDLGYRDLTTGNVHCDNAAFVDLVTRTTAELYRKAHAPDEYVARHRMPDDEPAEPVVLPNQWDPGDWDGPVASVATPPRGSLRSLLRRGRS